MYKATSKHQYGWINYLYLFLFCLSAGYWIYGYHKYRLLAYQEGTQLFRTDFLYAGDYLSRPGGIMEYAGSFLVQYYSNYLTGTIILIAILASIYLLLYAICRRAGEMKSLFVLPCLTIALYLFTAVNPEIRSGCFLGVLFILLLFLIYTFSKGKSRFVTGIIVYFAAYFIAGGNAFLLLALICVDEIFLSRRSFLYLLALIICAVATPYIAYHFIYITTPAKAWFALTPFELAQFNLMFTLAWISTIIVYLLCRFLINRNNHSQKYGFVRLAFLTLILAGLMVWGVKTNTNKGDELLAEMVYQGENANWDRVIELGTHKDIPVNNLMKYYYLNLALSGKGVLADQLFRYPQIGQSGLFMSWILRPDIMFAQSDLYYHLGIMAGAEQCVFESFVSSKPEHGSKTLKRLLHTNMLRRDKAGFEKYIVQFERSPVYKKWALQQRMFFEALLFEPDLVLTKLPARKKVRDHFMDYDRPENNLINLLMETRYDQNAFEYLICSFLLQKDIKSFLAAMRYYKERLPYNTYPRYIQEAIVFLHNNSGDDEDLLAEFPVDRTTETHYRAYVMDAKNTSSDAARKLLLQKKFGDTFWYYYQYAKPIAIQPSKLESRY